MPRTKAIDNGQDVIDSRDVIERIAELESIKEDTDQIVDGVNTWEDSEDAHELKTLQALAEEASASPDWQYGEGLIRDSYFTEYAEQLADDIGAIDSKATWPLNHIDWDAAADALKQDYMEVDFDGVSYWIRA